MKEIEFNRIVGKNIEKLLYENGLSKIDFARQLNVSKTTVYAWINGEKSPRINKVDKICNMFGITREELITDIKATKAVKIPIVGSVHAGVPIEAIEDIIGYEEITPRMAQTGTFFGLKVKGDCMSPRIVEGDTVIVKKQETADTGDVVVALVDNEAEIKKLIKYDDGTVALVPINPSYPAKRFDNITIIGKVVELRVRF